MDYLELLAEKNILNRYQIEDIREQSQGNEARVDELLLAEGVDDVLLAQLKAQFYGIQYRAVDFQNFPFSVFSYIALDAARHYQIAPVAVEDDVLVIGMLFPGDQQAQNAIQFIANQKKVPYRVCVVSHGDFQMILDRYQGGVQAPTSSVFANDNDPVTIGKDLQDTPENINALSSEVLREDSPAKKAIDMIVENALEGRASDIHIEHTGDKVLVRYRVDGILHPSLTYKKDLHQSLVARVKILAKLKLDEHRKPQDGRFYAIVNNRKIDFRVSILPTFFGEKVVIRVLDPDSGVKTLAELGMSEEHLASVRAALARPYGMILLTGPTGSGKSTTVYAMLSELDREKLNIVSLEDPIEYNIEGISQSQVEPKIGYDFSNGLRSILRQDPDVIMVGEIRDRKTARLAIQAALTGHLVISTLHTNNAVGVVPRLIDMGIDPYLIAPTLILSVGQRLVRKIAPEAKVEHPIDEAMSRMIQKQFSDYPKEFVQNVHIGNTLYDAKETAQYKTGTFGRLAVFEMMPITDTISRAILDTPTDKALYDLARKEGMLTMKEDALMKCSQGLIPFTEVNTL